MSLARRGETPQIADPLCTKGKAPGGTPVPWALLGLWAEVWAGRRGWTIPVC